MSIWIIQDTSDGLIMGCFRDKQDALDYQKELIGAGPSSYYVLVEEILE